MNKNFFLILGMHRSGTSCLTGALERCELYLGNVQRKNKHNKKGNFEIKEIYTIHDQILALNKSYWYQPPEHEVEMQDYHKQKLNDFIQKLKKHTPCGLKDPRTLLLINGWKGLLKNDYQLIGSFRHPMAVAQSLQARGSMSIEHGLKLWFIYNAILVKEHKKNPFPLIEYNLSNKKDYIEKIKEVAVKVGLKPKSIKLNLFISSKLEHQKVNDIIPETCKSLYNYLQENAI